MSIKYEKHNIIKLCLQETSGTFAAILDLLSFYKYVFVTEILIELVLGWLYFNEFDVECPNSEKVWSHLDFNISYS